jgi:GNAT superfamily N-acetyltransferase
MLNKDIPVVVELILRNWDEVLIHIHKKETFELFRSEVSPEWLEKQLYWKEMYVLEDAGRVIATGSFANFGTDETPKMSVSMFFVSPDYHSKGIGRMLLEHLFSSAISKNIPWLHVPSSKNAIRFYERLGFIIDQIQPDEAVGITWMTKNMDNLKKDE